MLLVLRVGLRLSFLVNCGVILVVTDFGTRLLWVLSVGLRGCSLGCMVRGRL